MVQDGRIVDAKRIATILHTDRFARGDRGGFSTTGWADVSPVEIRRPKSGTAGTPERQKIG